MVRFKSVDLVERRFDAMSIACLRIIFNSFFEISGLCIFSHAKAVDNIIH